MEEYSMNHREQLAWQRQVIIEEMSEWLHSQKKSALLDDEEMEALAAKKPETLKKRGYLRLQIEH
ncbi:hypothetical protein CULT_700038 [[Clostridium] ultunense Esp]|nr:hypothetical protein CULT_700038 [[Clostridium] ultunense Esp]